MMMIFLGLYYKKSPLTQIPKSLISIPPSVANATANPQADGLGGQTFRESLGDDRGMTFILFVKVSL